MELKSYEQITAYYEGKREGVRLFAWWKDGLQYVGTYGTTLAEALKELYRMELETKQAFSEGTVIWSKWQKWFGVNSLGL